MRKILNTLAAGTIVAFVLSSIGCSDDSKDGGTGSASTPTVRGVWKEEDCNMGFETDGTNFIEYMNVTMGMRTFAGAVVNDPDLSAEHGLIVVRITDVGSSAACGAEVGKYTVARWKTLAGNTVGQTYARDANRKPIFYATEAEVRALTEESPELNRFCCEVSNRM